jgi:hypothetical protein
MCYAPDELQPNHQSHYWKYPKSVKIEDLSFVSNNTHQFGYDYCLISKRNTQI